MEPGLSDLLLELLKPLGPIGIAISILIWRLRIADAERERGDAARAAERAEAAKDRQAFLTALSEHREVETADAAAHRLSLAEIVATMRAGRDQARAESERILDELRRKHA